MLFKYFFIIPFILLSVVGMEIIAPAGSRNQYMAIEKENIINGNDKLMELANLSTSVPYNKISSTRQTLRHVKRGGKSIADVCRAIQPLPPQQRLEGLLNLSEKGERLVFKEVIDTINLLRSIYEELDSKGSQNDLKPYLSMGKRVVNAIIAHSLQPAYFGDYVHLIECLAYIGDRAYKSPTDKMKLFYEYKSFHNELEDLMRQYLVNSSDKISYYGICLKVLKQVLELTDDTLKKKELLHQIIEKSGWILLLKTKTSTHQDIELLLKSYNQLYCLETDGKAKVNILENALNWGKILKENGDYILNEKLQQFISFHILQYEKWKEFETESLLPYFNSEADDNLPQPSEGSSDHLTFLLPDFASSSDLEMLNRLGRKV